MPSNSSLGPKPFLRSVTLDRSGDFNDREYLFNIAAVQALKTLRFHPDVTFLVGENGPGKSTLLEAIAIRWGFNAEGGSKNFNFATRPSHSDLFRSLSMVRSFQRPSDGFFLRAESFYNVATAVDELGDVRGYGGRSLHEQSHGESFFAVVMERFLGHGLYILDEPEAALSPTRQMALLRRIHQLVNQRSQFIIATHSPILLAYPNARILMLTENGFSEVEYRQTDHFVVTREFLNNPERMLKQLLAEDDEDVESNE